MNVDLKRSTRDTLLFIGGFAGVIYEAVAEQIDRPYLLGIFGYMMGLPWFLNKDQRKGSSDSDEKDESR